MNDRCCSGHQTGRQNVTTRRRCTRAKEDFLLKKKMHYIICRAVFSCFTTKLQCSVPLQKHYLVFWPAMVKSFNHALCFFFCHRLLLSLPARPTGFDMSDVFVSVCIISPCEPSRGTTKMSIMSCYELQRMEGPQRD